MHKIEDFDITSELLQEHWDLISNVYVSLSQELQENKPNEDDLDYERNLFHNLYDILLEEWKNSYSKFVLEPIRENVLALFYKAQTTAFNLQKSEVKVYYIHYYLYQYFSLGIQAHFEFDDLPDIRLEKPDEDLNLLLYEIFEELWEELALEDETGEELFYDKSEFYNVEVDFLKDFLSECWNETKSKTNEKVIGILGESTGADVEYSLDDNTKLKDLDAINALNS